MIQERVQELILFETAGTGATIDRTARAFIVPGGPLVSVAIELYIQELGSVANFASTLTAPAWRMVAGVYDGSRPILELTALTGELTVGKEGTPGTPPWPPQQGDSYETVTCADLLIAKLHLRDTNAANGGHIFCRVRWAPVVPLEDCEWQDVVRTLGAWSDNYVRIDASDITH